MDLDHRRAFGLPLGDWLGSFLSPKYLPMGLALYLGMFTVLKFVLLLFDATDTADRWVFELTPAFLGNLPDLQLVFLGAILAGAEAYLQYGTDARHRYLGMGLAGVMAAGLVLGLYAAGSDPTGSNPMRLVTLALVLGIVVLDHFSILAGAEAVAEPIPAVEAVPSDVAAEGVAAPHAFGLDADLDEILAELGATGAEGPQPEAIENEIAELDALAREAEVEAEKEEQEEEEIEQDAEFSIKDLEAFETWLETKADENGKGKDSEEGERRVGKVRKALRARKE